MSDAIKIPRHVSIVMDGNGRWAKMRGKKRLEGHKAGEKSVRSCTEECVRQGVRYLSLFAFSEENWARPKDEVEGLMTLLAGSIKKETKLFTDNKVRLRVLGNRSRLDPSLNADIAEVEELTKDFERMDLIVFLSYSGKWDILQAAKRFARDAAADPSLIERADLSLFGNYLVTAEIPDPDLIIRTSGEQRISNYLLWQAAYSEFYFTDVLWPDFDGKELLKAFEEYSSRDRRYGKVK